MSLHVTFICQLKITCAAVFFNWILVEHMKVESCRCNKVALANYRGIVVNRYPFSARNYLLKIFTYRNVHFKSVLEPYKCQIANIFQALPWSLLGAFRAGPQTNCTKAQKFPIWAVRKISGSHSDNNLIIKSIQL